MKADVSKILTLKISDPIFKRFNRRLKCIKFDQTSFLFPKQPKNEECPLFRPKTPPNFGFSKRLYEGSQPRKSSPAGKAFDHEKEQVHRTQGQHRASFLWFKTSWDFVDSIRKPAVWPKIDTLKSNLYAIQNLLLEKTLWMNKKKLTFKSLNSEKS